MPGRKPHKDIHPKKWMPYLDDRYDVSLRTAEDESVFKVVAVYDDLPSAVAAATALGVDSGRDAIVWDRAFTEVVWPRGGLPPKRGTQTQPAKATEANKKKR